MDQDNQGPTVFDINKPHTYSANPSARPVITGHQPQFPDPMVTPPPDPGSKINVKINSPEPDAGVDADSLASSLFSKSEPTPPSEKPPAPSVLMEGEPLQSPAFRTEGSSESAAQRAPYMPVSEMTGINTSSNPVPRPVGNEVSDQQVTTEPKPGVFGSHSRQAMEEPKPPKPPKKRSKTWLWLTSLLVVLAGLYAAVDKDLVLSNINLPIHIFKQSDQVNDDAVQPTNTAPTATPNTPAGFTATKLIEAGLSFAYPTAWGAPAAAVDQGFTKRSATAKPDANHAYVVTFPNNKDVELAVTSGKVLPPTRATAQYYDFLGWCEGTADGKLYEGTLAATTENNVDTPATAVCATSLPSATKISSDTIVQNGLKASDGSLVDKYTKNLSNPNFVVFRSVDKTMKNADQIKSLLGSIENLPTSQ